MAESLSALAEGRLHVSRDLKNVALAGDWSDCGLTERDKHRGERRRRCVRPLPLEDRKLKIRQ